MTVSVAIIDLLGTPCDGSSINKLGIGGCESAMIFISRELVKLGLDVTIFNNCHIDGNKPGTYDGVKYKGLDTIPSASGFDVVISERMLSPFASNNKYYDAIPYHDIPDYAKPLFLFPRNHFDNILKTAKYKVLWLHDTYYPWVEHLIEPMLLDGVIDRIFTLSDWHTVYITNADTSIPKRNFEVLKRKVWQTRNGAVQYDIPVSIDDKDQDQFIVNMSSHKGLELLIYDIWPKIKEKIPTAKLTVLGGYYRTKEGIRDENRPAYEAMVSFCLNGNKDVVFTGVIPQKEVAEHLAKASFQLAPYIFPETYGISILEAQLYNTPVITNRFGAAEETAVDEACYKMDYPMQTNNMFQVDKDAQVAKFVNLVMEAYNDKPLWKAKAEYCNTFKDILGWDSVALQWKQHFYKQLGLYLPVEEYRAVSEINNGVATTFRRRFSNVAEQPYNVPKPKEQRIVVISPFYNAKGYIQKCVDSVQAQDYDNYIHILIDDKSNELGNLKIHEKVHYIPNEKNMGAVYNQINTIRKHCQPDDIVMLLDGDDWLVNDPNIFNFYNDIYHYEDCEFTYGSCWSIVDNIPLIAQEYPPDVKANKSYRSHKFVWNIPYPHLRTFRKRLLDNVPDSAFQDKDGKWYGPGGDNSVFYNILEQADPNKVRVVQDIFYNYNDTNPLNDYKVNKDLQTKTANEIVGKTFPLSGSLTVSTRNPPPPNKFTVVIPTMWKPNVDKFTGMVCQLIDAPLVDEVIIISNDNTTTLTFSSPKIKVLDFGKNIFVNPAWNVGVKEARNDFICILNDDVYDFDFGVFEKAIPVLADLNTGVIGLSLDYDLEGSYVRWDGDAEITPWDFLDPKPNRGYGCLMFINKKNWIPIPDELKIYCGDYFIFESHQRTHINYNIKKLRIDMDFATTVTTIPEFKQIAEKEQALYKPYSEKFIGPLQTTTAIKVLIAIPVSKNIEPDTFKSIYDLDMPSGVEVTYQSFFGNNIAQLRNLIADWTVKGYDYLLAVDNGIVLPKNALTLLLKHNLPMVSGITETGQQRLELFDFWYQKMWWADIYNKGLVEIGGCNFNCVLIKKEVFEKLGYPQFEYIPAVDTSKSVPEYAYFCGKVRDKDFKIFVDSEVKCRVISHGVLPLAAPRVKPFISMEEGLRDLSNIQMVKADHYNYLLHLREDEKYQPKFIYDIGAACLHWTNMAKLIWPNAQYYAFDGWTTAEFIYKENGIPYHLGVLSDRDGRLVSFHQDDNNPGGNSYFHNHKGYQTRLAETLDKVVSNKNFLKPDLIKMDVQGAELDILKGATNVLAHCKDLILELQNENNDLGIPLAPEVIHYLDSIGFGLIKANFAGGHGDGDYHFRRRDWK